MSARNYADYEHYTNITLQERILHLITLHFRGLEHVCRIVYLASQRFKNIRFFSQITGIKYYYTDKYPIANIFKIIGDFFLQRCRLIPLEIILYDQRA